MGSTRCGSSHNVRRAWKDQAGWLTSLVVEWKSSSAPRAKSERPTSSFANGEGQCPLADLHGSCNVCRGRSVDDRIRSEGDIWRSQLTCQACTFHCDGHGDVWSGYDR